MQSNRQCTRAIAGTRHTADEKAGVLVEAKRRALDDFAA
jgi:hypothetical protein